MPNMEFMVPGINQPLGQILRLGEPKRGDDPTLRPFIAGRIFGGGFLIHDQPPGFQPNSSIDDNPNQLPALTTQQNNVLALGAIGLQEHEIKQVTNFAASTVKNHRHSLLQQLRRPGDKDGPRNIAHAVSRAFDLGYLEVAVSSSRPCLSELPPERLQEWDLHAQGFTHSEVGTLVNYSEPSIKNHIRDSLKTIGARNIVSGVLALHLAQKFVP